MGDPESQTSSSNTKWVAACGGCCLFLLVAGGVGGYLLEQKAQGIVLDLAAQGTVAVAKEMFAGMAMPDEEVEAAMAPVEAFAEQVRTGQVSIEQGLAVGEALAEGHVPALVMARGFEAKHLKTSGLSDEEKEEGHVTATRFAYGVSEEAIPDDERDAVLDMLTETVTTTGPQGQQRTRKTFKDSLTDEELREVLARMDELADDADVSDQVYEVDLAAEIAEAIEQGMNGAQ